MDEVAKILQEARSWARDGLIENDDYTKKKQELLKSIIIPKALNCETVKSSLYTLKMLFQTDHITETEFTELKSKLLATLSVESEKESKKSQSSWIPNGHLDKNEEGLSHTDMKYFGYYADFAHQELMLNDLVRTGSYHQAVMSNRIDFVDKVVIDIGAGTGILSMFAAHAGAKKVYAVEASDMADTAEKIIAHNKLNNIIQVVKGKVEDLDIPEKADVLISEPLGFWLINEQMIQTYVLARDKWLKPGGLMFPAYSQFCIAPCYVPDVRKATLLKSQGWLGKTDFYNLDFTCVESDSRMQCMERMVVDQILPSQVLSASTDTMIDFRTISVEGLNRLTLPFKFKSQKNILWDAVGMWFDTYFVGSSATVCLATAPNQRLTCWYQTLCLLPEPAMTNQFEGYLTFVANQERTYDVTLFSGSPSNNPTKIQRYTFTQPVYRYYEHFQELIWDPTTLVTCPAHTYTSPPPPIQTKSASTVETKESEQNDISTSSTTATNMIQ